ncbi:SH3 domain-containing protein [uncultured Pseudodesulfovibrio sp.]|uniref:SH3 domain-containing protein n=1 Tax=uncultured Pseudodesulfovibrio sp. TaxID=2035858 RepID=UPI0029C962FA|nr:SH3 domain-containing protein [uncultured Pseudodesulfovibrio sp.]
MRKVFSFLFVVFCLALSAAPAFAFGEIMYSDRPLNLRDARSPRAEWVGSLYAGQKVRVAHEKDGWVAIYEPDATDPSESKAAGFSNAKFLKPTRDRYEPKPWGELAVSSTKLNIRSKPSVRGTKVLTLQAGERVIIDFPEDDWIVVFPSNATIRSRLNGIGYASAKYLEPVTDETAAAPEPEPAPAPAAPVIRQSVEQPPAPTPAATEESQAIQRVVLTNEVNVHQSRTTTSPMVQTLRPGDVVQLGLLRNGWYAVFKTSDMIRSESSSMGYSLQSAMEKSSREAGLAVAPAAPVEPAKAAAVAKPAVPAKPEPATETAEPLMTAEALKAEALKTERPEPTPRKIESEPNLTPVSEPARQQTLVIDRSAFKDVKRPDPTPDKTAHGYRYKFLEKSETREYGQVWITLKVFLSTTKLPDRTALRDFASSLWKDHRRVTKNVLVEVYLPGMNMDDLAWGVVKFDYDGMTELWTRRATLFGTKFI